MASNLTETQVATFKLAFEKFDKNGDGTVSVKELAAVMKSLDEDPTEAELERMMDRVDADRNGAVDFKEFLTMMAKMLKIPESEEDVIGAFKAFDKNGNGYITASELRRALRKLGENRTEQEIEEIIRDVDTDGDGQINYVEFAKMMK